MNRWARVGYKPLPPVQVSPRLTPLVFYPIMHKKELRSTIHGSAVSCDSRRNLRIQGRLTLVISVEPRPLPPAFE